jgi:hypothetical protein
MILERLGSPHSPRRCCVPGLAPVEAASAPLRVENHPMPSNPTKKPPAKRVNKREKAVARMRRPNGATLAELTKAADRQPHSARAVISGLRQDGHAITLTKRDSGESCYVLAEQG